MARNWCNAAATFQHLVNTGCVMPALLLILQNMNWPGYSDVIGPGQVKLLQSKLEANLSFSVPIFPKTKPFDTVW